MVRDEGRLMKYEEEEVRHEGGGGRDEDCRPQPPEAARHLAEEKGTPSFSDT